LRSKLDSGFRRNDGKRGDGLLPVPGTVFPKEYRHPDESQGPAFRRAMKLDSGFRRNDGKRGDGLLPVPGTVFTKKYRHPDESQGPAFCRAMKLDSGLRRTDGEGWGIDRDKPLPPPPFSPISRPVPGRGPWAANMNREASASHFVSGEPDRLPLAWADRELLGRGRGLPSCCPFQPRAPAGRPSGFAAGPASILARKVISHGEIRRFSHPHP